MLPNENYTQEDNLGTEYTEDIIPNRTYKLDWDSKTINGMIDDTDAKKQAISKILMTEAETWLIYDFNYGRIFDDVIGSTDIEVVEELKAKIAEALMEDERFIAVSFTDVTKTGHSVEIAMTVTCADGTEVDTEVAVDV